MIIITQTKYLIIIIMMKREIVSLIVAAQEQALNTNSVKSSYQVFESDKYRLCGEKMETMRHITNACENAYRERENTSGSMIKCI